MRLDARDLTLWIWPVLQIAFLVAASAFGFKGNFGWGHGLSALTCIILAALSLCMTLHVTAHEVLHRGLGGRWHGWLSLAFTLLLGVSYRYYRIHHGNHHRHNNGLEDFSSTWKAKGSHLLPRNFWAYGLFWPLGFFRLPGQIRQSLHEDLATKRDIWLLGIESAFGLGAGLAFLSATTVPLAWITGYGLMVYWGWVFVSWHNYGQHLPIPSASQGDEADITVTSFANDRYNSITHGNGLHAEHHAYPGKPTHRLQREPIGIEIHSPPLWAAIKLGLGLYPFANLPFLQAQNKA